MALGLIDKVQQQPIENEDGSSDEEPVDVPKQLSEQISDEYKLFEVVTSTYPKQVLRYISPQDQVQLEPLWTSDKRKLKLSDVPKCKLCGAPRQLEL